MRAFVLAVLVLAFSRVHAGGTFELNSLYLSDAFTYTTETANSRLFWDVAVGFTLTKKGQLVLSWNYGSLTFNDSIGANAKSELTVTDMGPKLSYYFDKELTWCISGTYNIKTTGSYSSGSGSPSDLRGTSMKFELGYLSQMTDYFFFGLKLNYYSVSFNEEITNTTTLDQVSHKRTTIYPSLAMVFRVD